MCTGEVTYPKSSFIIYLSAIHNEGRSKKFEEANSPPDMLSGLKRGRYQKKMIGGEEFEFNIWHNRYFI